MNDPRFPELTPNQIRRIESYGTTEHFEERTRIFERGLSEYDFFVVVQGSIRIEDVTNDNALIVEHGPNEFSGDAGMLSSRVAQFDAFTVSDTTLIRVGPRALKKLIGAHSDISDILLDAFLQREHTVLNTISGGIRLIGSGRSKETYALRDFMEKNHVWHEYLDIDSDPKSMELLENFGLCADDLPFIIANDQKVCTTPTIAQVAKAAGLIDDFGEKAYDLLVIGAGPAGLAASVYGASEGLNVVTIDGEAPGGQAGKSSKIENYLGFPMGISGGDLAQKAYVQAQKFGCKVSIPSKAEKIVRVAEGFEVTTASGELVRSKAVMVATGAKYRRLPIDTIADYEGRGVYYSATGMDVRSCTDEVIAIVGGGNSAGQAALFLAQYAKTLHIMIRGEDLGAKMSDYLVQRIMAKDNIHLQVRTSVKALHGTHHLESITIDRQGTIEDHEVTHLFSFIGAQPCTDWMDGLVKMDEKGFIRTGSELDSTEALQCAIYTQRPPQSLETSLPGLFAVGDVRMGSVKRVASAVGEGSMAISQVHRYLGDMEQLEVVKA